MTSENQIEQWKNERAAHGRTLMDPMVAGPVTRDDMEGLVWLAKASPEGPERMAVLERIWALLDSDAWWVNCDECAIPAYTIRSLVDFAIYAEYQLLFGHRLWNMHWDDASSVLLERIRSMGEHSQRGRSRDMSIVIDVLAEHARAAADECGPHPTHQVPRAEVSSLDSVAAQMHRAATSHVHTELARSWEWLSEAERDAWRRLALQAQDIVREFHSDETRVEAEERTLEAFQHMTLEERNQLFGILGDVEE